MDLKENNAISFAALAKITTALLLGNNKAGKAVYAVDPKFRTPLLEIQKLRNKYAHKVQYCATSKEIGCLNQALKSAGVTDHGKQPGTATITLMGVELGFKVTDFHEPLKYLILALDNDVYGKFCMTETYDFSEPMKSKLVSRQYKPDRRG